MINTLTVAEKIFEILSKKEKIKCSFFRKDSEFCYIKVENYRNSNQNCVIVENDIFFQVDDEEYFELEKYEEATKKFINKLEDVVDVAISYIDENGELVEYGFYSTKSESKKIIEDAIIRLKNEYSFMKKIEKMRVSNFYGDFGFEAKWDGKTFVENTSIKR